MSIQVTFTFPDVAAAVAMLGALPGADKAPGNAKPAPAASPSAAPADKPSSAKTPAPAPEKPKAEPKTEEMPYETLQKAVFKLAGLNRDAAVALNGQFGVKTMRDLPAEKRPTALAAVEAKIAELEAA